MHGISAISVQLIYLSTHSSEKVIEMEIGIYITANIICLAREIHLGDRIGSFSLLERWLWLHSSLDAIFPVFFGH